MTDSLLSAIYDFKTLKIVRWRNGLQFSYICLDGIMKKMKCQHSQIWLTTRLAKLSYYVDGYSSAFNIWC